MFNQIELKSELKRYLHSFSILKENIFPLVEGSGFEIANGLPAIHIQTNEAVLPNACANGKLVKNSSTATQLSFDGCYGY